VPIRELTPDEEARLLTQEEVNALPDGTAVCIKWAGGNGPFTYILWLRNGIPYVGCDRVEYVGNTRTHTRVFLPSAMGG
jgi:hypothetical protein